MNDKKIIMTAEQIIECMQLLKENRVKENRIKEFEENRFYPIQMANEVKEDE